jgi:hybrid cluster-associated redox disulfide protein
MKHSIHPQLTVAELLSQWPQAIPVFFRHRMTCVGCSMAGFDTLEDVSAIYHLPLSSFLQELEQAVDRPLSQLSPKNPISKGRYS